MILIDSNQFFNRYKVAKRDNDSVYFEKVPTLASLPAIQGSFIGENRLLSRFDLKERLWRNPNHLIVKIRKYLE
jgi:hypothetical protein